MQEVSWKKQLPRRSRKRIYIVVKERVQRVLDNHIKLRPQTVDRSEEAYTASGLLVARYVRDSPPDWICGVEKGDSCVRGRFDLVKLHHSLKSPLCLRVSIMFPARVVKRDEIRSRQYSSPEYVQKNMKTYLWRLWIRIRHKLTRESQQLELNLWTRRTKR